MNINNKKELKVDIKISNLNSFLLMISYFNIFQNAKYHFKYITID